MINFCDLFYEEEFPSHNQMAEGIPENTVYSYVSSTYVNGFVNYINPFYFVLVKRYSDDKEWEKCIESISSIEKEYHLRLSKFGDDILLLGETENNWWYIWYDNDVSDCCIGKFEKSKISKDDLIECFIEWIKSNDYISDYYVLSNKLGKHNGWLTF